MSYFTNPTILKILGLYKNLWALSYVSAIAHWDLETYMPSMGANFRGQAMGRISTIRQKMFLDKDFVLLIHKAEKEKNLTDQERGVVRVLLKSLEFYEKVPSEFLENFENLTNKATVVWREAKKNNNFNLFSKDLTKIFDENRRLSEYLSYSKSPYDALLDLYEEDLKTDEVSIFFDKVLPDLQLLLGKIMASKKYTKTHFLENTTYDKEKMIGLNNKILKTFWPEYQKNFRLDTSTHPFTTSFSKDDTRITTWYHKKDFARSLMATIHEFGHALYDLQSDENLEMTPIAGGSSLVIHESQSRFWENHIGRSKGFISKYIKDFRKIVDNSKLTVDDVYFYLNKVTPSLLRVEADEVTYHMHTAIRFEIERDIIEGKLKVKDIKEVWNSKMKNYLKVVPKKDSDGVLQDIHWSGGSVGYFPTYSLGTFLGAQWEKEIEKKKIKTNDYEKIKDYLKQNIHKVGSTYNLKSLLLKNKLQFDPSVNIKYLQQKYSKIYKF